MNKTNLSSKNSNLLSVSVNNYGECGWCKEQKQTEELEVPWLIWSKWLYLCNQMGSNEWGGVFWTKDNKVIDFKLPKQKVSSIECEYKEDLGGNGIVHSHHNMDAFHSSQDDSHARNLYEYSIVLSNKTGYEATKKVKLPCGGFGYVKIVIRITDCPDIDLGKIETKKSFISYSKQTEQRLLDFKEFPCDRCDSFDCDNCENFDKAFILCDECSTYDCKDCKTSMKVRSEHLPFCEYCENPVCHTCEKLAMYLKKYPEEQRNYNFLLSR